MASTTITKRKHGSTSKAKTLQPREAVAAGDQVEERDGEAEAAGNAKLKRKRDAAPLGEIEVDVSAPEPPSKKVLRKSKRQAATVSKDDEAESATSVKKAAGETVEAPTKRSEFGVWVGNLSFATKKEDLRRFLLGKGGIADHEVTRIHLPPLYPGKPSARSSVAAQNKGFAYVDFASADALEQALALSEILLAGRKLLIKNAKSFEGRPDTQKKPGSQAVGTAAKTPNKKVFIGNLSFDTSTEDLTETLVRCGPLTKVHVATFEDSGKCKGYAWAEFEDLESAEAAVRGWIPFRGVDGVEKDEDAQQDSKSDGSSDAVPTRRTKKVRRWWVNKLKGRTLRVEFAEDDATRYKKRFGTKEGSRPATGATTTATTAATATASRKKSVPSLEIGGNPRPRLGQGTPRKSTRRAREERPQEQEQQLEASKAKSNATELDRQMPEAQPPSKQTAGKKIKFDE